MNATAMTDDALTKLIDKVKAAAREVKPLTPEDSVIVSTCTQFELALERFGVEGLRDLCERVEQSIVLDSKPKKELFHYVCHIQNLIGVSRR